MEDITGQKFNRLIAIKWHHTDNLRKIYWLFLCECGNKKIIRKDQVKSGPIKSCGCYHKECAAKHVIKMNTTHGLRQSRFYDTWHKMKSRCNNLSNAKYYLYGARGIKVNWKTFEEFRDDMYANYILHIQKFGKKNTQIDRINNNGNYSKENCRWVTLIEQARNRRNNHLITYKGKTHCISEWAEIFGISNDLLMDRIRKGWDFEKAITPLCQ